MIGQSIAHYRVTAKIGAGGMGEVYRATDSRLGRDVALKVLPKVFAADHDRMARFEREAQLLASLSHPNIATIHGLEESKGTRALVMELVEGPTLAGHLADRLLPFEEALKIAKQIADALEYAHERGIIHRDLKPANVKITPEGAVKVLDFGLAKALEGAPASTDVSTSPTLSMAATKAGIILGTAAYMSPEQARGKAADRRADIWAFGVVLFEMLSGKQLYPGETVSDSLAAVITREPDWTALPSGTPARIRHLLERCLKKDPKSRLQAIGEARIAIEEALAGAAPPSGVSTVGAPALQRTRLPLVPWALVGLMAVIAVAALWGFWRARLPVPASIKRFVLTLPAGGELDLGPTPSVVVSPDGSLVVYRGSLGHGWQLYLRPMAEFEATPITGTEDATSPFFSPDGRWIGFVAGGKLKKVSLLGGAPVSLCDVGDLRGASWGPDGTIVLGVPGQLGMQRVSDSGGALQKLTTPDKKKNEGSHRWPEFLPGGEAMLFTIEASTGNYDEARIELLSLKTGQWRTLIEGGMNPHYSPSGHIIYGRVGTLLAVPFDLDRLEVTGTPVPVLEGVQMNPSSGGAQFSLSAEGSLVYVPGNTLSNQQNLVWVDRQGTAKPLAVAASVFDQPSISPDGKKVAVHSSLGNNDVWLHDLGRGTLTRFTFQPEEDESPVWTPDGRRVAFSSTTPSGRAVFWKNGDGSGTEERVAIAGFHTHLSSFSPDGRMLVFTDYESETRGDIWLLPLEGERKPQAFLKTPFDEREPKISPDGRWMAYTSDESGRDEIYVQVFPGPGGKWQISTEGGYGPLWARNGRELFFRNGDKVMSVAVTMASTFSASPPRVLFEGRYDYHPRKEGTYDVTPDGQRFLMIKSTDSAVALTQLHVLLNWFEELKRRAPSGNKR